MLEQIANVTQDIKEEEPADVTSRRRDYEAI